MNKRITLLASLSLLTIALYAQNMLHYATSANGQKGECLFPEDEKGNIVFSSVVEIPLSADSIMLIVDDYISAQNVSDKCVIKRLSNSYRTSTYSIQFNVGSQTWGIEFWGSPLFVGRRDASHVKFKCLVEVRTGKYKYTLFDFETNRTSLWGEAKNDGQSNLIHWQRVNSLTKERDEYAASNDVNKRITKEVLYDYNAQIAYETCLYQAEYDVTKRFVDGLKTISVNEDFIDITDNENKSEQELNRKTQSRSMSLSAFGNGFFSQASENSEHNNKNESNYSNYFGLLLEKNCNVFICGGRTSYEQAGVQELIKQVSIDGFWNIVDKRSEAHFVMEYIVSTKGRDKAYLYFSLPQGYERVEVKKHGSNESSSGNHEVARSMYLSAVAPLYKKIEANKLPVKFNCFINE